MKRDEIMAMQPGRELDALVAEKVMGWKVTSDHLWRDTKGNAVWLMAFSTDISAAWEMETVIYKKGISDDYGYRLATILDAYELYDNGANIDAFKIAHASPVDRCKAALLAVMEVSE